MKRAFRAVALSRSPRKVVSLETVSAQCLLWVCESCLTDALIGAGVQKRDVFSDVTSGSRTATERPGMKRLLDYAQHGDTVVVWRIDRLGRSLIDVLETVNLLRERGVKIRSISDGIDPETSSGSMMLATLAEYERELITERVNAGIAAAKQNGARFGRPPVDQDVIAEKLEIAQGARAKGRAAEAAAALVGWSRATLYRHQHAVVPATPCPSRCEMDGPGRWRILRLHASRTVSR